MYEATNRRFNLSWSGICFAGIALAAVLLACGTDGSGASPGPPPPHANVAVLTISAASTDGGYSGVDPYDYGRTRDPLDRTFVVKNTGAVEARGVVAPNLINGFSFKAGVYPGYGGNCAGTIAAHAECSIVITFDPTNQSGQQSVDIVLNYFDGSADQTVKRTLSGISTAQSFLVIEQCVDCYYFTSPLDWGGPYGTRQERTFFVHNYGAKPATQVTAPALENGFSFKGGSFPGVGGSCPAPAGSIPPDIACSIVIQFDPVSRTGSYTTRLSINYADGSGHHNSGRDMKINATTQAYLSFIYCLDCTSYVPASPSFDFGTIGLTSDKTLYVYNSGAQSATGLSISALQLGFSFKGGAYPGVGGSCPAPGSAIASGERCTIVVSFNPAGLSGRSTNSLSLSYFDGTSNQTLSANLAATATSRALLSFCRQCSYPSGYIETVDYGQTGTPIDRTFSLTNVGGATAAGVFATAPGNGFDFKGGPFPGVGGTCSANGSIAAGETCTMVLTFNPAGQAGTVSRTLVVSYHDVSGPLSVQENVSATVVTQALLRLQGYPTDFGTTGIPVERLFSLTNAGGARATNIIPDPLQNGFSYTGGTFPGSGGNCPSFGTPLEPGATCLITITFDPAGREGIQSSAISLSYYDGTSAQTARQVISANAIQQALLQIGGSHFDFGTTGVQQDRALYIQNIGARSATNILPAALTNGFSFKGGSFPGIGGTCPSSTISLPSGAYCTIVINFNPAGRSGAVASSLSLSYFDGLSTRTVTADLTATVTNRAFLRITTYGDAAECTSEGCSSYSFWPTSVGSSSEQTFVVLNTGAVAPNAITSATLSPPFAYKGGSFPGSGGTCNLMPSPGASCTIVVTFTPTSAVYSSGSIALDYDDGLGPALHARKSIYGTGR